MQWLKQLALLSYPEREALKSVELPDNEADAWRLIANIAGVSTAELASEIARQRQMKPVVLGRPDRTLAKLIPEAVAVQHGFVPAMLEGSLLVIAVATPDCAECVSQARFVSGRQVEARIAPPDDIENVRLALYAQAEAHAQGALAQILDLDDAGIELRMTGDANLVRFCRALVKQAIQSRASDIHLHPFVGGGVVRLRIDGQLRRVATIPSLVLAATIRLFKSQGGMDSTNRILPQDGRASVMFENRDYELRLSTLPSTGGEALVIRLLDQSRTFDLEKTNFAPWALQALKRLSNQASGLVLITGPTGSGKTSTLYSILATLNRSDRRLITVEEPVEYKLPGLSQVEVNKTAGLTFSRALRAILRQDPDILLIGEIRDAETAEIAVQAALTGHLVFSTLHTRDAIGAIPRLTELGVPPVMLADTLLGVVSQRLLRQLCPHCKSPASEPLTPVEALFREVRGQTPGARATGCEACGYTGYIGRFPVVEVVEVTEQVRSQLLQGEFDADSLRHGMPESWRSIEENAANWVISGLTTAQEAYANLGQRFWNRLAAGRGQALPAVTTFDEVHGERQQPVALIVTPDQRLSSLIGQCLTELGFANHLVDSGTAAASFLKRMRQTHFIVVDGRTPHGDARPLLRDLSSSLAWSGLPAVVIYDPDQKEVANLIIEHTGTDGVPTPIDPGLLRARIRGLLSR